MLMLRVSVKEILTVKKRFLAAQGMCTYLSGGSLYNWILGLATVEKGLATVNHWMVV